eukprot:COSAG02_NODE_331_length_24480_cov_22.114720_18_plen_82_part_00
MAHGDDDATAIWPRVGVRCTGLWRIAISPRQARAPPGCGAALHLVALADRRASERPQPGGQIRVNQFAQMCANQMIFLVFS